MSVDVNLTVALIGAGSALVGALLASVTSFYLQRQSLSRIDKNESKVRYRASAEELYLLIDSWGSALGSYFMSLQPVMLGKYTYNEFLDMTIASAKEGKSYDFSRIEFLLEVDHPELSQDYRALLELRDHANELAFEYKRKYEKGEVISKPHSERMLALLLEIDSAISGLKKSIATKARRVRENTHG